MLFEKIELEKDEVVLKVIRKHWFVIVSALFSTFTLVFIPVILLFAVVLFPGLIPATFNIESHLSMVGYGVSMWLLFSVLTGFMTWTHYYLDLWIVTDRRIIVIDQVHFFNRKVSSFRLERLQDIKVTVNGVLPTFLNFGTIEAVTASSSESNFTSPGFPDPRGIQSLIQKATDSRLEKIYNSTGRIIQE